MRPRQLIAAIALAAGAGCAHAPAKEGRVPLEGEVVVTPGLTLEQLGGVAVATFVVDGTVRAGEGAEARVHRKQHPDTMDATEAFIRQLVGAGVKLVDRQFTDQRLAELKHAVGGLVDDESAPSIGSELGAATLVVGRYRFNCTGGVTPGEEDLFVRCADVHSQSISVKGFELSTGRVLFDAAFSLGQEASAGRLVPKSLSGEAAKRLLARLQKG